MIKLILLKTEQKKIEGKDYFHISIYEEITDQHFDFYRKTDEKSYNFIKNHKLGDDVTDKLCFVIKKGKKISFDIK